MSPLLPSYPVMTANSYAKIRSQLQNCSFDNVSVVLFHLNGVRPLDQGASFAKLRPQERSSLLQQ